MGLKVSDVKTKTPAEQETPVATGGKAPVNVLVIGESGTGKSTSIRNLDPKSTFIFKVLNKPLPFKKGDSVFSEKAKNFLTSDRSDVIKKTMLDISANQKHIKVIIIDDFTYIMTHEFMRRAKEKGYDKFSEMAEMAWEVIQTASVLRGDLAVIFLTQSRTSDQGITKMKTIGKMLDEKVTVEGYFTLVLQTVVTDEGYRFMTKNNGSNTAKTPMDMFEDELIDNDLQKVVGAINKY